MSGPVAGAAPRAGDRGRSVLVHRPGRRLRVLSYGERGPDVLVLPGITSPAATWEFVALELAGSARVHVLDLPGRGLSDPSPDGYSLEAYADDACAAIDALGLVRPAVLGHSLGARIAAALAIRHPGVAGALVLVDPPLTGPGRDPYPMPLERYLDGIRAVRAGAGAAELRASEPGWSDEQLEARAAWLGTCDETAIAETHASFSREDFHALWRALDAPVLVHGGGSPVVTPTGVDELRRENPSARFVAVADAGHMVPWDDLPGFLEAVRPWLSASPPTSAP